jgi:hypothetical protein
MAFLADLTMSEEGISCDFIGFFEAVRHGKRVFRAVLMDDVGSPKRRVFRVVLTMTSRFYGVWGRRPAGIAVF